MFLPFRLLYSGGADQTRTDDPLLAKQVLYQLSYNPRTLLLRIPTLLTDPLHCKATYLYQLSYNPRTLRLSFESQHILYIYLLNVKSKNFNSFSHEHPFVGTGNSIYFSGILYKLFPKYLLALRTNYQNLSNNESSM